MSNYRHQVILTRNIINLFAHPIAVWRIGKLQQNKVCTRYCKIFYSLKLTYSLLNSYLCTKMNILDSRISRKKRIKSIISLFYVALNTMMLTVRIEMRCSNNPLYALPFHHLYHIQRHFNALRTVINAWNYMTVVICNHRASSLLKCSFILLLFWPALHFQRTYKNNHIYNSYTCTYMNMCPNASC